MNIKEEYQTLIENLKNKIDNFEDRFISREYGIVKQVGDGIAIVEGLKNATIGQGVIFLDDGIGMIISIEQTNVYVILLSKIDLVKEGTEMFSTGAHLNVPCSEKIFGRVLDALGRPIDGLEEVQVDELRPIEAAAEGIMKRSPVCDPLQTGIKIIDALIPIGLGQRQLILGDRQTGKTALAIDTILNQTKVRATGQKFVYCIYVAIGKKASDIARLHALFKENGALEYTTIIAATASDSAGMQYIAPMAGTAIAEYFKDKGKDVLVVFDDLSSHADAYREISLLIRRQPARGAYPGDIFYLHSRLLERAAKLERGGSITMLPIINCNDVSDYVATNVISITDGQIYLDKKLFFEGNKPAIDIGISVSRIGSSAQYSAMKKISGRLRGELAQFKEYEAFAQSMTDLDPETKKMVSRGRLLVQLFRQNAHAPISFSSMIFTLFGAIKGLFDHLTIHDVSKFEQQLHDYIKTNAGFVYDNLNEKLAIDDELEAKMIEAIKNFTVKYDNTI